MKTCYHWDVSETGQCPKCATLVTVEEAITVSVGLGTAERPPLSGDIVVNGYRPSVRDAIGLALGVTDAAVDLIDVTPREQSWEGVTARFRLVGSKVDLYANVRFSETLVRSPERVEYEPVETEA